MTDSNTVEYDEFGYFSENAAEFNLPYDVAPVVRRERIEVEADRWLSALRWGDATPDIVLLHGGAQNAHTWDTVALALRPLSILAIDLPGHGHSDGPGVAQRRERSPAAAADDVAVAIRELAPDAGVVVGMSFGGLTAIALADMAPDLVRRLLLVDVLPGLKSKHSRHIVDFVNGPATFASFDDILARTMEFNPARSETSLRRGILHNAIQLADGSWVWRHSRWRLDDSIGPLDAVESAPPQPSTRLHTELVEPLTRLTMPVLLARGLRPDSVLRDDDEADLRSGLPNADVVHFDEAGHSIQGDMPVELAMTIRTFLGVSVG
jgi:pimeloyl-ACP methyl ester carboxylesterase